MGSQTDGDNLTPSSGRLYIPVFNSIRLAVYSLLNILMCEQLQHKRDVIRVEEQLRHVLELEDIYQKSALILIWV